MYTNKAKIINKNNFSYRRNSRNVISTLQPASRPDLTNISEDSDRLAAGIKNRTVSTLP